MPQAEITTTLELVRLIVKHELELADDRIFIYNQKWDIPTDNKLFAVVGYRGSKIISSRNTQKNTDEGYVEVQDLNTQEQIVVQIFSRDMSALERKEEVVMALYSIFSQQQQGLYSFQIARNAPIEDLSALEASAILYRFDIPIIVFAWYEKIKSANYYDVFHVKVRVNDGQPDMVREFVQPLIHP